ncbi:MAG TPA: amidohydrolase family protein [Candidatus Angelobacter sp.]
MNPLQSRRTTAVLLALTAFVLLASLSLHAQQKTPGAKHRLALVGARIYPAPQAQPISDGVVLIENGKIVAVGKKGTVRIPADAETLDCTGRTIVAGFWNSHVHFTEPKWLNAAGLPAAQLTTQFQEMLTGYGFTSVVDTASLLPNTVALRKRVESGEVAGPRILTAGGAIYPKDGIPYYVLENIPPEVVKLLKQAATPEDAVRIVDEQVAQGADIIKLFVVSWVNRNGKHVPLPMPLPIVQAAAAEAHRKGKLVFAHPSTIKGVELVLEGHVDVLAHTTEDPENWSPETIQRLKAAHVSLIPTLTLFCDGPDFNEGIPREVKNYADAGGEILFGTDVGYLTNYPELDKEFGFLEHAGLTFPRILAALTTAPAARLGFGDKTGRVARGQDADLVVLQGDPAQDVNAFSRVKLTLRQGRVIYQAQSQ